MGSTDLKAAERVAAILRASAETHERAARSLPESVAAVAAAVNRALDAGGKVLLCGNGGSAADAQHLAAELAGRLRRERRGLPAISLTVNSSVLTAVSNDYGYDMVFARQVEALGRPGDVLVGISTSGSSPNVVRALEHARAEGLTTVGLIGERSGDMEGHCDLVVRAPSDDTQRIQEIHIAVGHAICELVEAHVAARG
ncbi:MAG: D-sedoheptulose 7-phosphate isomerase [Candidatus Eisenbacteria bacterium]